MAKSKAVTVAKPSRAVAKVKQQSNAVAEIIQDSTTLGKAIAAAISTYQSIGVRIHLLAVSALWHCATTGNAVHLQRLYDGLRSNDQVAFKLWLRRTFAIVGLNGEIPDGLPAERITAAVEQGKLLDFKNGTFVVVNGHTSDQAKATAKLMVERYANPDGERDRMVLDRNNFAEIRTMSDADALAAIVRAATVPENGENRVINLKASTKKLMADIKGKAEAMLKQYNLADA